MNKKAQVAFVALMLGIICFVLGMALANPLKVIVAESRGVDYYNCSNSTSQQAQAYCTQLDMIQPLYVGIILGLAGMLLAGIALR
jgi:hypothetical protein